jgi:beta-lactam-binding protein with PASTA domain
LLTVAGLHVPVTPFEEVVGSEGTVPPEHIVNEDPKLNTGVTFGLTVTVNVAGKAHWPAVGVNV